MKQLLITIAAAILATVSGIAQSGQAIGNRAYWLWENQSEVDFKDGFEIKLLDRCALKLKDESSLTVFLKGGLPFLNNTILLPALEIPKIKRTKPTPSTN